MESGSISGGVNINEKTILRSCRVEVGGGGGMAQFSLLWYVRQCYTEVEAGLTWNAVCFEAGKGS